MLAYAHLVALLHHQAHQPARYLSANHDWIAFDPAVDDRDAMRNAINVKCPDDSASRYKRNYDAGLEERIAVSLAVAFRFQLR